MALAHTFKRKDHQAEWSQTQHSEASQRVAAILGYMLRPCIQKRRKTEKGRGGGKRRGEEEEEAENNMTRTQ